MRDSPNFPFGLRPQAQKLGLVAAKSTNPRKVVSRKYGLQGTVGKIQRTSFSEFPQRSEIEGRGGRDPRAGPSKKVDFRMKMGSGGNFDNFIIRHFIDIFLYYTIHTTKML